MSKKNTIKALLCVGMSLIAGAAVAHHSFAMFDRSREEVLDGTVVRWAFNSPHIALYLETADGTLYSLEGAGPVRLLSVKPAMNGFTFKPGQHVRAVYCPLHDGRPGGAIGYIIDDDGVFYRPNDGGCQPSPDWEQWLEAGFTSRADAEAARN